jgi:hypothetical protein
MSSINFVEALCVQDRLSGSQASSYTLGFVQDENLIQRPYLVLKKTLKVTHHYEVEKSSYEIIIQLDKYVILSQINHANISGTCLGTSQELLGLMIKTSLCTCHFAHQPASKISVPEENTQSLCLHICYSFKK